MGAVQAIPIIGGLITIFDSLVKIGVLLTCLAVGQKDTANQFKKDIVNSWVEYSDRNVIVASIRAAVHYNNYDGEEASRVLKKMFKSIKQVMDVIPVVGHIKGAVHYIVGDTEHGNDCMIGASRTLVVAGAGALTGGVGGAAVGGMFYLGSGVAYDAAVSKIESSVKGKDCRHGIFHFMDQASRAFEKGDVHGCIESVINTGYCLTGDIIVGAAAAKIPKKLNISYKRKAALTQRVGKEGTNMVVDAAKTLEAFTKDVKGDNHVCTKVKNLDTGKESYGMNRRCRGQMRENEYKSKGKASGYSSKTNAKKGNLGEFEREAGILETTASKFNMNVKPKAGINRALRSCAEHHAFNNLNTHGFDANILTASVTSRNGNITATKRCDNCLQFGSLMGDVITDRIAGMSVPTKPFVLDTSWSAMMNGAFYGTGAVLPFSNKDKDNLPWFKN